MSLSILFLSSFNYDLLYHILVIFNFTCNNNIIKVISADLYTMVNLAVIVSIVWLSEDNLKEKIRAQLTFRTEEVDDTTKEVASRRTKHFRS